MPQECIHYILQMNYTYAHYDLCALFFLSNSFTSWSWQESRSAPRCVHLSMNSCVEAAVSLPWCCYAWLCLIWQNAHVTTEVEVLSRSLKCRWPDPCSERGDRCAFSSVDHQGDPIWSPCRVPRCEGILRDQRWSKMIKGQKRSVTWCDLMWLGWCCELVKSCEYKAWHIGRDEESEHVEIQGQPESACYYCSTSQGPGWKNFNALTFALKVVESSSSVYAKVMRLWLLGIVWDCLCFHLSSRLTLLRFFVLGLIGSWGD